MSGWSATLPWDYFGLPVARPQISGREPLAAQLPKPGS
jgi:hypothetical protein